MRTRYYIPNIRSDLFLTRGSAGRVPACVVVGYEVLAQTLHERAGIERGTGPRTGEEERDITPQERDGIARWRRGTGPPPQ